ncbi:MAG: BMC domain-containing protein [Planctomycetes bacterium]|nr:BMC domain-containing protein [Planctomycetota bacterium]
MKPSFDDLALPRADSGEALALLEFASIAQGYAAADRAVKAAAVTLLLCRPASPGKLLVLFCGAPSAVVSSLRAAQEGLAEPPLDTLLLPQAEPRLLRALAGARAPRAGEAAAVVECATVATLLLAADAALKTAAIELQALHAANGLGGKAFCVMSGAVAQVEVALAAAVAFARERGQLLGSVLLAQPHDDVAAWFAGGAAR